MRSNSCAFAMRAATFFGFLSAPCLRSSIVGAACASFAISKLKNARRYRGQLLRTLAQLRPACRMQRDRTSKYSWSVRGLLPGRQRLASSFANVHSQGARWLMLYQLYGNPSPPNGPAQRPASLPGPLQPVVRCLTAKSPGQSAERRRGRLQPQCAGADAEIRENWGGAPQAQSALPRDARRAQRIERSSTTAG